MSEASGWGDKLRRSGENARSGFQTRWAEAGERARAGAPEPPPAKRFAASSWPGAMIVMVSLLAVLFVVQVINAQDHYRLDRFGLRPRHLDGLWGIVTSPFLHASWDHLLSNSVPFVIIGWVVLIAGLRGWVVATAVVVVLGGLATWLVAPDGLVVGASGLVFGWLGYLVARAYFIRSIKAVVVAVVVLAFFGTLLGGLLPNVHSDVSWQGHVCGFVAGLLAAALLHVRQYAERRVRR